MSFVHSQRTTLDMAAGPQAVERKRNVSVSQGGSWKGGKRTDDEDFSISVGNEARYDVVERRTSTNYRKRIRDRTLLLKSVPVLRRHLAVSPRVEVRRRRKFLDHEVDRLGRRGGHSSGDVELNLELDPGFEGGFGGTAEKGGEKIRERRRGGKGGGTYLRSSVKVQIDCSMFCTVQTTRTFFATE